MLRRFGLLVALLAGPMLGLPGVAQAHMFGLSLTHARTPPVDANPSSGSSGANMSGSYDWTDDFSLDLGLALTRPMLQKPTDGSTDQSKPATAISASAGASYMLGDHWFFLGALSFSPASDNLSTSTITADGKNGSTSVDALIRSTSAAEGLLLSASWETAGDSDHETEVSLTLGGAHLITSQKIVEASGADAKDSLVLQALINECATKRATDDRCKRLTAGATSINSLSVGLSVTEKLYTNNEITLGGTYYLYDKDPNEAGYFNLASQGKGTQTGTQTTDGKAGSLAWGTGVALAPSLWSGSLGFMHKFGDFKLTVAAGMGAYLDDDGVTRSVSLKGNYKINGGWRVLAALSAQRDISYDAAGATNTSVTSYSGVTTVRYSF